MKITDFLSSEAVIAHMTGRDKNSAIEEMASLLAACHHELDQKQILEVFLERERISTTAIGEGVAIPHGKLPSVERVIGGFARSRDGIDFASLDGEPTHLFFALLAPQNAAADHLKALARISRLLKDEGFRQRLMQAKSSQELYALIADEDEKF